jgi:hypothetical protein
MLKISKNVTCAKRWIPSFPYILTYTLTLQYQNSLTSSLSPSTLFTVLISPDTHSQNIHCQYLNHSHLNFKATYCSDNTNSHFLPQAMTTMAYPLTTRTYPVHVRVFDKHYLFCGRTVSSQNNVTKCYETFVSHNITVIKHTQWQELITVPIYAATVLSAAKAAVTYKLWPLMWSEAWRRNGKLRLQKTSG